MQEDFYSAVVGINSSPEAKDGYTLVKNKDGATLGHANNSGIKLLTVDRYAFKDLNKNGSLDAYEDWRLPVTERTKDLAKQMSLEDIAGLMLYSSHQSIPGSSRGFGSSNYGGKTFEESGALASELSDEQKKF